MDISRWFGIKRDPKQIPFDKSQGLPRIFFFSLLTGYCA